MWGLLACLTTIIAYQVEGMDKVAESVRRLFGSDKNFNVKPTTGGYALVDSNNVVFA